MILYLHNVHLANATSLKIIELLATSQSSNQGDDDNNNNNQQEDAPETNLVLMLTYHDDEVMNDVTLTVIISWPPFTESNNTRQNM